MNQKFYLPLYVDIRSSTTEPLRLILRSFSKTISLWSTIIHKIYSQTSLCKYLSKSLILTILAPRSAIMLCSTMFDHDREPQPQM